MKKILFLIIFCYFKNYGQEISFEKGQYEIVRKTVEQDFPIKIILSNSNSLTKKIKVKIFKEKGDEVSLNPKEIVYEFDPKISKEYIFNLHIKKYSEGELLNVPADVYFKLSYDFDSDNDKKMEQFHDILHVRLIPFSEPKEEKSNDFPKLVLFGGTNIDPLGENAVSAGSFNFEYNFDFTKLYNTGIQFGLYSNKNFTKDSLSKMLNYYAPDILSKNGLIQDSSFIYTELIDPRISTKTRSNGGYLNFTMPLNVGTDTKMLIVSGLEFVLRKFSNSADPKSMVLDSTKYKKNENRVISSKPFSSDRFSVPQRSLNQLFINLGVRFENTSDKIYITLQPMISFNYSYEKSYILNRQVSNLSKSIYGGLRTFIVYKPANISLLLDMKIRGLESNFVNFSVGVPVDIKGLFVK